MLTISKYRQSPLESSGLQWTLVDWTGLHWTPLNFGRYLAGKVHWSPYGIRGGQTRPRAVSPYFPPTPISTPSLLHSFKTRLRITTQNILSSLSTPFIQPPKLISPTIDFESSIVMPPYRSRSSLRGINHPLFKRISPTIYLMKDPDYPIHTTIHVGQITEYLKFDEQLRTYGNSAEFRSIPIGFNEFCNTWNDGAPSGDPRRISTVFLGEDTQSNHITPSDHPVYLRDFHVSPAQAGIAPDITDQGTPAVQAEINQAYAALMVRRQKRERQFIEERREKKMQAFKDPSPDYSYFNPVSRRSRKHSSPKFHNPYPPVSSSSTQAYYSTEEQNLVPDNTETPEAPEDSTLPSTVPHHSESAPMETRD